MIYVIALVTASEEMTQLAAIHALEVLWQPSDFKVVFDRYLRDPSDSVRKAAAWTIRKNINAEHWEQVFAAWSKDAVPRHRVWASQISGSLGDKTTIPILKAMTVDANGHVRRAAQKALEQVNARYHAC